MCSRKRRSSRACERGAVCSVSPRSSRIFFFPVDVVDPDAISSFVVVSPAYHYTARASRTTRRDFTREQSAWVYHVRALTVAVFVSLCIALTRPVVSAADAHCSKRFRLPWARKLRHVCMPSVPWVRVVRRRRKRDGTDWPTDGDVDEARSGSRVGGFSEPETNRVGSSASCAKRASSPIPDSLSSWINFFAQPTEVSEPPRITIDTASLDFRDLTGKLR